MKATDNMQQPLLLGTMEQDILSLTESRVNILTSMKSITDFNETRISTHLFCFNTVLG